MPNEDVFHTRIALQNSVEVSSTREFVRAPQFLVKWWIVVGYLVRYNSPMLAEFEGVAV